MGPVSCGRPQPAGGAAQSGGLRPSSRWHRSQRLQCEHKPGPERAGAEWIRSEFLLSHLVSMGPQMAKQHCQPRPLAGPLDGAEGQSGPWRISRGSSPAARVPPALTFLEGQNLGPTPCASHRSSRMPGSSVDEDESLTRESGEADHLSRVQG